MVLAVQIARLQVTINRLSSITCVFVMSKVFCCTLLSIVALTGCNTVTTSSPKPAQITATTSMVNPHQLLIEAQTHRSAGRAVPALQLTQQAIASYEAMQDWRKLGATYTEYAKLLRSPIVPLSADLLIKQGFIDRQNGITFDNRIEKSREIDQQAITVLSMAEQQSRAAQEYDLLTNIYVNQATAYLGLQQIADACRSYDLAIAAYQDNRQQLLQHSLSLTVGGETVEQQIQKAQQQLGCAR